MGLVKGALKLLLMEGIRRPYYGKVLTLGKQDIFITYDMLVRTAKDFGFKLFDCGKPELHPNKGLATLGYISDNCLFKSLGFSESFALEEGGENANVILDLNVSDIPDNIREAFDVIIDGGTIEHVFHIPNCLNNLYKMLRINGRVIHLSPSHNYVDHGFYMLSPTLFCDYYTANKFEINSLRLTSHTPCSDIEPWLIFEEYKPGCLDNVNLNKKRRMFGVFCVVTKTEFSTGNIIPPQGICRQVDSSQTFEPEKEIRVSKLEPIKAFIRKQPFLYRIARVIYEYVWRIQYKHRRNTMGKIKIKVAYRY